MRNTTARREQNSQRGVALLLVIFAIMLVSAIAFGMMSQTDTETAINSNFRDQQSGYYAATVGLEEGRDRMRVGNVTLPTLKPGQATVGVTYGVTYITNPKGSETVAPWTSASTYVDDEICKEAYQACSNSSLPVNPSFYTSFGADSSYSASSLGIEYKWARLTLKLNRSAIGTSSTGTANPMYVDGSSANPDNYVCWDGTKEVSQAGTCASTNFTPVYHLTSLAVTSSGSRRMLQYELTQDSLGLNLNFPGALSLLGPSVTASFPTSNGFHIDGTNHTCSSGNASSNGTTTGGLPAIGVGSSSVDTAVTTDVSSSGKPGNYTGSGGSTPDVEATSMPSDFQSPASLEALLSKLKSKAINSYSTNPSSIALGSYGSPILDYVDGDVTLSGNTKGYGVLVVTGTLTLGGNFGWQGPVLVVGKGIVIATGGGNGEFDGAMVVATTRDGSGNVLSSFGTPTYNWGGGGGNGMYYSSGCLSQNNNPPVTDYKILSSRELLY